MCRCCAVVLPQPQKSFDVAVPCAVLLATSFDRRNGSVQPPCRLVLQVATYPWLCFLVEGARTWLGSRQQALLLVIRTGREHTVRMRRRIPCCVRRACCSSRFFRMPVLPSPRRRRGRRRPDQTAATLCIWRSCPFLVPALDTSVLWRRLYVRRCAAFQTGWDDSRCGPKLQNIGADSWEKREQESCERHRPLDGSGSAIDQWKRWGETVETMGGRFTALCRETALPRENSAVILSV